MVGRGRAWSIGESRAPTQWRRPMPLGMERNGTERNGTGLHRPSVLSHSYDARDTRLLRGPYPSTHAPPFPRGKPSLSPPLPTMASFSLPLFFSREKYILGIQSIDERIRFCFEDANNKLLSTISINVFTSRFVVRIIKDRR